MPGSSLWLIPPRSSIYCQHLQTLISTTIPAHIPDAKTHDFIPHVTVTSQIDPSVYGRDPQAWIGGLALPPLSEAEPVPISLDLLEPGDPFFKKLTVRALKAHQLLRLVATCRAEAVLGGDSAKAAEWAQVEYLPHLSLMYADIPASEVQASITLLLEDCQKAARAISADAQGTVARGGSLVLVDTSKPISAWQVIAERELSHLLWTWPWSKSSFDD